MHRREFLGALFGAAAAAAILPSLDFASPVAVPSWCESAAVESLKVGDVFSIEGVYAVNPLTYAETDILQRFVITADVVADAPTEIWPTLRADGIYQNVGALPSNNARLITYTWEGQPVPVPHVHEHATA